MAERDAAPDGLLLSSRPIAGRSFRSSARPTDSISSNCFCRNCARMISGVVFSCRRSWWEPAPLRRVNDRRGHSGSFLVPALTLVLAFALAGLGGAACSQVSDGGLTVTALNGEAVDPFAVSGAKAIVFIFTRSDCSISNRYAPVIRELSEAFAPGHVVFRLVYLDREQSAASIRAHARSFGYRLELLRDPQQALARRSQISVTPEAAVYIFLGGRPRLIYRGRIDDQYTWLGNPRPRPTTHDLEEVLRAIATGRPLTFRATPAAGCAISELE